MINETRFKDLAERDNFIAVYPFITSYDGMRETNCWGFFLDQHIHKGAGEAEDLHQIALEIEAELKIDPNRRYVTGLSSGAGMSVALAVAHSDYFAAAGSVEGLPYAETSSAVGFFCANPGSFKPVSADVVAMKTEQQQPEEQRPVPIMAIHSRNDCVVINWPPRICGMPGSAVTDLAPRRLRHWIVRPKACPAPRQGMAARSAPWSRQSFTTASVAISSAPVLTIGSATTADNSPIRPGRAPASCNGLSSRRIRSARPRRRRSPSARLRSPEIRSA